MRVKVRSVRMKVRGRDPSLDPLLLIPEHVSQVSRLLGQCEGASRGPSMRKKVCSVRIELHALNFYFCIFARFLE